MFRLPILMFPTHGQSTTELSRAADEAREEKRTRVTFEIEPVADVVRLTVTHDRLDPGSEMLQRIANGWPKVLSSLKSLMEVGRPLPELSKLAGADRLRARRLMTRGGFRRDSETPFSSVLPNTGKLDKAAAA